MMKYVTRGVGACIFCWVTITTMAATDNDVAGLLGIPYRADGVRAADGRYTTFMDPDQTFDTPGLNCSGLVTEIARMTLGRPITIEQIMRPRPENAHLHADNGPDWDFGWRLIMNISDGLTRRVLMPGGTTLDIADTVTADPIGYHINAPETWAELPARLTAGHLYLISFNTTGRKSGYQTIHYHVGAIYVDQNNTPWLYQTTGNGGAANRRNLATAAGQESFQTAFHDTRGNKKYILVLEIDIPGATVSRPPTNKTDK
ncbi:MAG: hypothetical protein K2L95_00875 [Alphaproteobacteria bacterium]|nr:hypothetical protein [Alphaproteobacteria bacterium]